jgi:hypothetical protein
MIGDNQRPARWVTSIRDDGKRAWTYNPRGEAGKITTVRVRRQEDIHWPAVGFWGSYLAGIVAFVWWIV